VGGADGGRLFVRCFDAAMTVRENIAGDVLASPTTLLRNTPFKAWTPKRTEPRMQRGSPRTHRALILFR
jgi:hypothetical protein